MKIKYFQLCAVSLNLGQKKSQTMVKYIPTSQTFEKIFMKILKWIVLYNTRDFSLYHSYITFICLVYKLKLSDFVHVRSVPEKKWQWTTLRTHITIIFILQITIFYDKIKYPRRESFVHLFLSTCTYTCINILGFKGINHALCFLLSLCLHYFYFIVLTWIW